MQAATSARRLRVSESAVASRFVFSRKIRRPATSDFATKSAKTDISPVGHSIVHMPVYFAISNAASPGMETP